MKNIKRVLFILALALTCGAYGSTAQIFVTVRPDRPHYERTVAPGPNHVWIDEEWEPRGNSYVFTGGHWAEPPHRGQHWQQGHWNHNDHGHQWKSGGWRR
jgi:YXWGXW repeat-containing protein